MIHGLLHLGWVLTLSVSPKISIGMVRGGTSVTSGSPCSCSPGSSVVQPSELLFQGVDLLYSLAALLLEGLDGGDG